MGLLQISQVALESVLGFQPDVLTILPKTRHQLAFLASGYIAQGGQTTLGAPQDTSLMPSLLTDLVTQRLFLEDLPWRC